MKKFILLLMILPACMFASGSENDYQFIVDNTVMVDAYWNIFNSMASIFSSDTYYDLLKLAFLLGGFFVFAGGILASIGGGDGAATSTVTGYTKYYLTSTALLIVLFSTKATMWVTTDNIPSFCDDVSPPTTGTAIEMPSVLAFTFSTTNLLGRELTQITESVMSKPSSTGTTSLGDQGGFAGAIKQGLRVLSLNPNEITMKTQKDGTKATDFNTAWQIFFSKCVYEVSINKGESGIQRLADLEESKDLSVFTKYHLETPFPGTTKQPGESLVELNGQILTCQQLYDVSLTPKVSILKNNVSCGLKEVNSGALQLIYGEAGLDGSHLESISVQAGLIYNLSESKRISGIGINSGYATGKTIAEQNQTNLASAGYMAKVLPYVQMTMRAVLYGFFPFVFIIVILPGGLGVLKSYGQTMAWIELWGPTAAVVNMMVNLQAEAEMSDKYTKVGLTMISAQDMMSEANTIAGAAGMLYLSIPALTWLILKGSGHMLGNFTSGMAAGFGKNLSTQSMNQDSGNLEKKDQLEKKLEKELGKVISYGEMQHLEARNKGASEAGILSAQIENGSEAVFDSAIQNEGIKTKEAALKKKLMGGNDKVINSAVAANLETALTKESEHKKTGIVNESGNIEEKKIKNVSEPLGATFAKQKKESIKALKNMDIYDEKGNYSSEKLNSVIDSGAWKKASDELKDNEFYNTYLDKHKGNEKKALANFVTHNAATQLTDQSSAENYNKKQNIIDNKGKINNSRSEKVGGSKAEGNVRTDQINEIVTDNIDRGVHTTGKSSKEMEDVIATHKEQGKRNNINGNKINNNQVSKNAEVIANTKDIKHKTDEEKLKQYSNEELSNSDVSKKIANPQVAKIAEDAKEIANQKEHYADAIDNWKNNAPTLIAEQLNALDHEKNLEVAGEVNRLLGKSEIDMKDVVLGKEYRELKKAYDNDSSEENKHKIDDFISKNSENLDTNMLKNKLSNGQLRRFNKAEKEYGKIEKEADKIRNRVSEKYRNKKIDFIQNLNDSGFINAKLNKEGYLDDIEVNKTPTEEMSNFQMGERLSNYFKSTTPGGYRTEVHKDEFNNVVAEMKTKKNGRIDKSEYGANTQELLRRAGVSEEFLYDSNSALNLIKSATSVTGVKAIGKVLKDQKIKLSKPMKKYTDPRKEGPQATKPRPIDKSKSKQEPINFSNIKKDNKIKYF